MANYKEVITELEHKGIEPYFGEFFDPDGFLNAYFFKNFFRICPNEPRT